MKKSIIIVVFSILICNIAFSQPWLSNLPENKTKSQLTFFDYQNAFNEHWKDYEIVNGWYFDVNGQKHKAYGWKQFKRWENFWQYRVNPTTGEFPKTNAGLEFNNYIQKNGVYKEDVSNWTCLGTNSSDGGYAGIGRINTVAFHPTDNNTFWIGAPAGGLWVTYDNGDNWAVLTDSNDVLGVSAIVIPSDYDVSSTIYIGTGDRDASDNYSVGVLKSTDGGLTWQTTGLIFSPADRELVNNMKINPNDNNIIYAATSDGFYKTIDAGVSWNKTTTYEFIDIELCPNNPDIIYGSTRGGAIHKSIDAGETWTYKYSSGGSARVELAVTADNPAVVYAVGANGSNGLYAIFKSSDYAETFNVTFDDYNLLGWYEGGSGDDGGQGWYDLSLASDPNDENIVYVGGVNTWKSTDGGVNWSMANHWYGGYGAQAVHADKHYMAFRNNESVLFEANDGGIYTTIDGESWTDHTNGITISQIYGLSTAQTVPSRTILGLQDNGTKLQDNSNWYDVLGGDGMKCLIDYTDEDTQYGSLYYGDIHRTTNNWSSETCISDNIPGGVTGAWVTPYLLDPFDNKTIYIGYDKLWKSTNQGNSFEEIGSFGGDLNSLAICQTNPDYIYAGRATSLYKTTDGGETWTPINSGLPLSQAPLTYIEVKFNDPNTVWVTLGNFNEYGVYQTTDGGQNWTNISAGLPQIPVNCIIQNTLETAQDQLYAGTDFGVFIKNGDEDWTLFSKGLPNVVVTEFDIYYDFNTPENSRLRASTYGRGLWETPLDLSGNFVPYVLTGEATEIQQTSAVLSAEITNDFSSNVIQSGIIVSSQPNAFINTPDVIVLNTNPIVSFGEYSVSVDGLTAGTTYYYRAFAENGNGIGYGSDFTFSTQCDILLSFPWYESVETNGAFPNCFINENISGEIDWTVSQGNSGNPASAYDGEYNFLIKGSSSNTGVTKLILPTMDLSSNSVASFGFWIYNAALFSFFDQLDVKYRNSLTADWINLLSIDNSITTWTYYEINLPELSAEYQIALEATINGGRGISVDGLYVGDPTGICNILSSDVKVYPNPAKNSIFIEVDELKNNYFIALTDISGKELKNQKISENVSKIDITGLSSGIYILKIISTKETQIVKIIVE